MQSTEVRAAAWDCKAVLVMVWRYCDNGCLCAKP